MAIDCSRPGAAAMGLGYAILALSPMFFASIACRPSGTSNGSTATPKPLIASLLGHWVTESGITHRYFSTVR